MKRLLLLSGSALCLVVVGLTIALGQQGYNLNQGTWQGTSGSLGSLSQGYALRGTSGQAEAAVLSGGNYTLQAGFWQPLPTATVTATKTLTPTMTTVPGQATATPAPGEPTFTPVPATATLLPGEPTFTPVPATATLLPGQPTFTPVPGQATATSSPTRTATPKANGTSKLQLTIRGPKQVVPGKGAFFFLTFLNAGNATFFQPRLIMVLPLYTLFDLANSTPGWVLLKTTSTQAGQLTAGETYVFEPGDLNASQSGEVIFATTVQADAPAGLILNAEASIGDSTSTGSTATAKSNTVVEVVDKIRSYLPLIMR